MLSQTHTNLELIVVDDGSTDGSGEICDDFASRDSRVKVFHQENSGISTARNTGLDHAHGEVIAFLDPDDAFCEDMIETLLETMLKDQSDIVMCKFSWHDTDSSLPKGAEAIEKRVITDHPSPPLELNSYFYALPLTVRTFSSFSRKAPLRTMLRKQQSRELLRRYTCLQSRLCSGQRSL